MGTESGPTAPPRLRIEQFEGEGDQAAARQRYTLLRRRYGTQSDSLRDSRYLSPCSGRECPIGRSRLPGTPPSRGPARLHRPAAHSEAHPRPRRAPRLHLRPRLDCENGANGGGGSGPRWLPPRPLATSSPHPPTLTRPPRPRAQLLTALDSEKISELESIWEGLPRSQKGLGLDAFVQEFRRRLPRPFLISPVLELDPGDGGRDVPEEELIRVLCRLFREIDVNGDGVAEWEEYTKYIVEESVVSQHQAAGSTLPPYVPVQLPGPAPRHTGAVDSLLYVPPVDALVALERRSPVVKVYDAGSCAHVGSLAGLRSGPMAVEYLPDHRALVTAGADMTLTMWELGEVGPTIAMRTDAEGLPATWPAPHAQTALRWNPTLNLLFSGSTAGLLHLWDVDRGREVSSMLGHTEEVTALEPLLGLDTLASASTDSTIGIWDVHTCVQRQVLRGHDRGVLSLAHCPDRRLLVSAGFDHDAFVWSPFVGSLLFKLKGHAAPVIGVEHFPSTDQLVTGDAEGVLKLWDLRSSHCVQTFHTEGVWRRLSCLASIPRHRRIVGATKTLFFFDQQPPALLRPVAHDDAVLDTIYNSASLTILTASPGALKMWDAVDGKLLSEYHRPGCADASALCLDDRARKVIVGDHDGHVTVLKYANGALMKRLEPHAREVSALVYLVSRKCVISASWDRTILLQDEMDPEAAKLVKAFDGAPHRADITRLALSQDESLLASVASDGTVRVWDVEMTKLDAVLHQAPGHVATDAVFLGAVPALALCTSGGAVELWTARGATLKYKRIAAFAHRYQERPDLPGRPIPVPAEEGGDGSDSDAGQDASSEPGSEPRAVALPTGVVPDTASLADGEWSMPTVPTALVFDDDTMTLFTGDEKCARPSAPSSPPLPPLPSHCALHSFSSGDIRAYDVRRALEAARLVEPPTDDRRAEANARRRRRRRASINFLRPGPSMVMDSPHAAETGPQLARMQQEHERGDHGHVRPLRGHDIAVAASEQRQVEAAVAALDEAREAAAQAASATHAGSPHHSGAGAHHSPTGFPARVISSASAATADTAGSADTDASLTSPLSGSAAMSWENSSSATAATGGERELRRERQRERHRRKRELAARKRDAARTAATTDPSASLRPRPEDMVGGSSFDYPSLQFLWRVRAHEQAVTRVALVEDPHCLLTSSFDGSVKAWTLGGRCVGALHQNAPDEAWRLPVDALSVESEECEEASGIMQGMGHVGVTSAGGEAATAEGAGEEEDPMARLATLLAKSGGVGPPEDSSPGAGAHGVQSPEGVGVLRRQVVPRRAPRGATGLADTHRISSNSPTAGAQASPRAASRRSRKSEGRRSTQPSPFRNRLHRHLSHEEQRGGLAHSDSRTPSMVGSPTAGSSASGVDRATLREKRRGAPLAIRAASSVSGSSSTASSAHPSSAASGVRAALESREARPDGRGGRRSGVLDLTHSAANLWESDGSQGGGGASADGDDMSRESGAEAHLRQVSRDAGHHGHRVRSAAARLSAALEAYTLPQEGGKTPAYARRKGRPRGNASRRRMHRQYTDAVEAAASLHTPQVGSVLRDRGRNAQQHGEPLTPLHALKTPHLRSSHAQGGASADMGIRAPAPAMQTFRVEDGSEGQTLGQRGGELEKVEE